MSKRMFIVAFKIEVEVGAMPLTVEEVLDEVKQMTNTCSMYVDDHYVGELKKNVGWNKNIDVLFQLWLEERCKGMWP
jgi:hypothetical protein